MELKITSRYDNIRRKNVAALWVGTKNIWDIDHEHVVEDVLDAIRNAYDLGREHALAEIKLMPTRYFGISTEWADERTTKTAKEKKK